MASQNRSSVELPQTEFRKVFEEVITSDEDRCKLKGGNRQSIRDDDAEVEFFQEEEK